MAGVSQPLLNHHFGGKKALWRVVREQITADFKYFMANAVDLSQSPGNSVATMLRAYLAFWKARPLAFRFNLWRRLDGVKGERVSRSNLMTRPVVALMQRAQEAKARYLITPLRKR
jgi:TetR/AcrR family transcriptional regulator